MSTHLRDRVIHDLAVYIPMDRRQSLANGQPPADRSFGAALFADISGFTPLTEALVLELGRQRGAEELTVHLNAVYDALINELHRYGGSVIAFAGDAITCWLDGDDGLRATAAALAMQAAMQQFGRVTTPKGTVVNLAMKAAVAVGVTRRFLVGIPSMRVIDALAGSTLVRLAAAEHAAQRGEVVLSQEVVHLLEDRVNTVDTRLDDGYEFAVVNALKVDAPEAPWPPLSSDALTEEQLRPWLLPSVYERLRQGLGNFLAELRPTVALFVRFMGIDYDNDPDAGEKLNSYISWVLEVLERYQGTLIDLNIGDKGSYIYVNFGAPIAHENNAARAASAALDLRALPPSLNFIEPVQIGISEGRMRAGAYGGTMHRTYGVLGDEVNMAARLMMKAEPGEILVSWAAQRNIADDFSWLELPPMQVKGKREPVTVFSLQGIKKRFRMHLLESTHTLPLVGREQELTATEEKMRHALNGHGQVISVTGEAGMGKSRFVAETIKLAYRYNFAGYGGECEAYGTNTSYLVWQPIWRGLLGIDPDWEPSRQIHVLEQRMLQLHPSLAQRVPLLGAVLNLSIPDNDLTRTFDAKLRKSSLEAMLVDCLRALARQNPMLIVLDECHWLDPLSYDLLHVLAAAAADLPILFVLAYRPLGSERLWSGPVGSLPYHTEIALTALGDSQLEEFVRAKLATWNTGLRGEPSAALLQRIIKQGEGNPFYTEELVNYCNYHSIDPSDSAAVTQLELPSSLRSLVFSRLDQLSESQKIALKVASVIGRSFRVTWLWGVYPELGNHDAVQADLMATSRLDLTVLDRPEPEIAYFFKHVTTHEVIYESLLHQVRTVMHEQFGRFLEETHADSTDRVLDLLAYHFDRSDNESKKREYLWKAGEAAQATYANEAAIDYYRRVLPLLPKTEQIDVLRKLGDVYQLVGNWDEAAALYRQALALAEEIGDRSRAAWCQCATGELLRKQGSYTEALSWFTQARNTFEELDEQVGVARVLHYSGTLAAVQGDYATARARYDESLAIRRKVDDRPGVADLLNNLAVIAEYQGDYAAAYALNEESLAIRRNLGIRSAVAQSLNNLGNIMLAQGDHAGAKQRLQEAVNNFREIGDRWSVANSLNNLGNLVRAQGDYVEAGRHYYESLTINRELGDKWAIAYLLEDIANLNYLRQHCEQALSLFAAAETLRDEIGAPLPPVELASRQDLLHSISAELEGDAAEQATRIGRELSLQQATEFALNSVAPVVLS